MTDRLVDLQAILQWRRFPNEVTVQQRRQPLEENPAPVAQCPIGRGTLELEQLQHGLEQQQFKSFKRLIIIAFM